MRTHRLSYATNICLTLVGIERCVIRFYFSVSFSSFTNSSFHNQRLTSRADLSCRIRLGHNRQREIIAVAAFVADLIGVAVGAESRAVGKIAKRASDRSG